MAALASITAVRPTADTVTTLGIYGATIAAGQSVYQDSADSQWKLADSNASAAIAAAKGVSMTPGIASGYGVIATGGGIILVGTTAVVGANYFVGAAAGSIVPDADLTTGDYVTRIGTAASATQINLSVSATGILHA